MTMNDRHIRRVTLAALLGAAVMFTNVPASAQLATTSHGDPIAPSGAVTELHVSLPLREIVDPSGKWLAILNAGFDLHGVTIVDIATGKIVSRKIVREAYTAMDFSADGRSLLLGGAGNALVSLDFDPATGVLGEGWRVNVYGMFQTALRALPGGDVLVILRGEHRGPASTLPSNPTDELGQNAARSQFSLARITLPARDDVRQNTIVRWQVPLPGSPSAMTLSADGKRAFVAIWHKRQISIVDIGAQKLVANVATPSDPLAIALAPHHGLAYVACAGSNSVAVIDTNANRDLGDINVGMLSSVDAGATPNGLAISRDERTLYVANADEDTVLRVRLDGDGGSVVGAISTGVYPTDVLLSADQKSLYVLDGKGYGVEANPLYDLKSHRYYVANIEPGMLERVNLAHVDETAGLADLRERFESRAAETATLPPIKHVIYLLKENRTYDQVLGDDPRGNGDPQLAMFGKRITPNVHAIVNQFVLLDNYRLEGEVSAPGWAFGFSSYADDTNQRTWPSGYGGQPVPKGGDVGPAYARPGGTLWDDALRAGLSVRLYNIPTALIDPLAAPFEAPMIQTDQDRVFQDKAVYEEWLAEFRNYEKNGNLPALTVMPFSGDHTWGTQPYQFTPNTFVAINDYYVGKMLDVLSHSRFWKDTVFITTEDDAQNGPDHVSSERSYALIAGAYVKRHYVDHTAYSMTGLLRTIEMLLGMKPMTEYDATGAIMASIFSSTPNLTPYNSLPNEVSLTARNPPQAVDAEISMKMRFDEPDENDPNLLNRVLWDYAFASGDLPQSARFAWTPPPPGKRVVRFDDDEGE